MEAFQQTRAVLSAALSELFGDGSLRAALVRGLDLSSGVVPAVPGPSLGAPAAGRRAGLPLVPDCPS